MCVHIILSSVRVARWPSFGKELLTRLTVCSLCFMYFCMFCYFLFGFEDMIWVQIAPSTWSLLVVILLGLCIYTVVKQTKCML